MFFRLKNNKKIKKSGKSAVNSNADDDRKNAEEPKNGEKLKKLAEIVDFLFPINVTCNACGRENFNKKPFCDDCEKNLPRLSGAVCNHCGRKTFYETERCDSCSGRETYFDVARSAYDYDAPVNELIRSLKYDGKRYISKIFAKDLNNVYLKNFLNCDFVLYVPMTEEREKDRGYNQARLLAEEFSRVSGVRVENDIIYKRRETQRQATLSFEGRRQNLSGSFGVRNRKKLDKKRVLLIDDVMTTGATAESVCRLLKKYGASFVAVLTVASVQKKKTY